MFRINQSGRTSFAFLIPCYRGVHWYVSTVVRVAVLVQPDLTNPEFVVRGRSTALCKPGRFYVRLIELRLYLIDKTVFWQMFRSPSKISVLTESRILWTYLSVTVFPSVYNRKLSHGTLVTLFKNSQLFLRYFASNETKGGKTRYVDYFSTPNSLLTLILKSFPLQFCYSKYSLECFFFLSCPKIEVEILRMGGSFVLIGRVWRTRHCQSKYLFPRWYSTRSIYGLRKITQREIGESRAANARYLFSYSLGQTSLR